MGECLNHVIITGTAPMYNAPEVGVLSDEVLHGQKVTVWEERNGFARVTTEYRYDGWVPASALGSICPEPAGTKVRVTRFFLDVQAQPAVASVTLKTLPRGAVAVALGEAENGWQKLILSDSTEGFVRASSVVPVDLRPWQERPEDEVREALAQTALSYLGCQYRWGGKTPAGIDCSGLCSVACLQQGIVIYRDADLREGFAVREIRLEDMKKGDFLYFPGHIAMALGEGRYIHSTAAVGSDGVVINSLDPSAPDYRADLPEKITHVGSLFA